MIPSAASGMPGDHRRTTTAKAPRQSARTIGPEKVRARARSITNQGGGGIDLGAWGPSDTVLHDAPDGPQAVPPTDLLAFRVGAAVVADAHLIDPHSFH